MLGPEKFGMGTDREVLPGCARVRTKCVEKTGAISGWVTDREVLPGCARVRTKCAEKTSVGL